MYQMSDDQLERLTEWPIYRIDSTLRRFQTLQDTPINKRPAVYITSSSSFASQA